VSAYGDAIDQTMLTIDHRARRFRNQIVTVVAVSVVAVAVAIVTRSAAALWFWLLLIPVCGFFLYADNQLLNGWRTDLLAAWTARDLDLVALCQAIRANPLLPRETVAAMLSTLPLDTDPVAEQRLSTSTRRAIAAAVASRHRGRTGRLLLKVIASAIVVGAALAALWARRWLSLAAIATLVLLPLIGAWLGVRRRAECEAQIAAARADAGFNEEDYVRLRRFG
jgi:hypothetical protein